MKITRRQLRQIINEDIDLEKNVTEDLTSSIGQHIQVLLDKAWPKAEFEPGGPVVNTNMPRANRFVLTYTFLTVGSASGLAGLKAIKTKFKRKVAGKAGFKSTPLDNRGNKIFKMKLANDNPVAWDGDDKKDAERYVKLKIHETLMDKFMATAKADPSIITDIETISPKSQAWDLTENNVKITRNQLRQIIKETLMIEGQRRAPKKWEFQDLVAKHGVDDQGMPNLTINISDDNEWTIGPSPGAPYTYGDIITGVPENLK